MNPRLPDMLDRLVALADRLTRAHDTGGWRSDGTVSVELDQLYGELRLMADDPQPDKIVDDTALLLTDCLRHLNANAGPLGDAGLAMKWRTLSGAFLPFVRTDYARARGFTAVPDAPDYVRAQR